MTMSTSERQRNRREEHLSDAELNELVDGTLAGRDLESARAHLTGCAECDERYGALLATVSALKQAPSVMPRRSFQLTPEQARLPEKRPSWLDRFAERILPGVPALKAATIAVALLLVSVTAFDVLTNQSGQSDRSSETSVLREADLPVSTVEITQPAATEMPMLGESSEVLPDAAEADTAPQDSETGGSDIGESEPALEAAEPGDSGAAESEAADDASFSSSAMQEAPPAPAAAEQQSTIATSPTVEPTPTSTPEPTATATATPATDADGWSAEFQLSWWRIAELGLLMLLIWLGVSWVGRSRVGRLDE